MNIGAPWPSLLEANERVLKMQTKLHRWAKTDEGRRFDDLYNLVYDPAFLAVAWHRVRSNTGARSSGVDGATVRDIERRRGAGAFLDDLRGQLKVRTFQPLPVRERMIEKPGTRKRRRLGIPTVADRVVQASLKLVLEPIFEADFQPCSYGFRPGRRAHDAIAEVRMFATNSYEWVLEADIEACFDNISHSALLARIRKRVGDKRVLRLVKAFLKSGILSEDLATRDTHTGTPQGGILSPLLANVALSVLDEHFTSAWQTTMATRHERERRRHHGLPTYRICRYADDFVVMVSGTRAHAEALRTEIETVLAPMGLHLSEAKTGVVHIDEGLDFLGFRIQRHTQQGSTKRYVYTYPSKKALASIKRKVKTISRQGINQPLASLLRRLNAVLRGWTNYFRNSAAAATFDYLRHYTWWRVVAWLRSKHRRASWKQLRRRYLRYNGRTWVSDGTVELFDPAAVTVIRYRYRGTKIPTPWDEHTTNAA